MLEMMYEATVFEIMSTYVLVLYRKRPIGSLSEYEVKRIREFDDPYLYNLIFLLPNHSIHPLSSITFANNCSSRKSAWNISPQCSGILQGYIYDPS